MPKFSLLTCVTPLWTALFIVIMHSPGTEPDGGTATTITKTSEKELSIDAELTSFYLALIHDNFEVKEQYEALVKSKREEYDTQFYEFEPRVIELPVIEDTWNASVSQSTVGHYAVLQGIGMARSRYSRVEMTVCAEFDVDYKSKGSSKDPEDVDAKWYSHTITIKFLGFRNFTLSPISPGIGRHPGD